MADKKITIVLAARNAMTAGIAKAQAALGKFGGFVRGMAGKIAKWMGIGSGLSVGAIFGFSLKAFARQEAAEKSLIAALEAHGEAADKLLPKLAAMADAIQDETGVGDEATLSTMARLRMLGVETNMLGQAARGVIGLTAAGLEGETAQRAMALAVAGNYQALSRYIPALRSAKSEAEKAGIVNAFITKGYAQQKAMLETTGGAWKAFRGRIGDVAEKIGEAFNKSSGLAVMLERAGAAAQRFGQRIREWIDSKQFDDIQKGIRGVIDAMSEGGGSSGEALSRMANILKLSFVAAMQSAIDLLKKAVPDIGKRLYKAMNPIGAAIEEKSFQAMEALRKRKAKEAIARKMYVSETGIDPFEKREYGDREWKGNIAVDYSRWKKENLSKIDAEAVSSGQVAPYEGKISAADELKTAMSEFSSWAQAQLRDAPAKEISATEAMDIAGKGSGAVDGTSGTSDYLSAMLNHWREMGHKVEQYAAGGKMELAAREQMQKDKLAANSDKQTEYLKTIAAKLEANLEAE